MPRAEASAWKLLLGPLPAALAPSEKHRVLQAALVWGDQLLGVEHLSDAQPLTVGEDVEESTFQVFHRGLGRAFELARVERGQLQITVPEGAILNHVGHGDVIFDASKRPPTMAFAPILSPTRKGMAFSMTWR